MHDSILMRISIATTVATAFACSSSAPTTDAGTDAATGDGGDSITSVANDFASADCARKFECMPYATSTRAFGDDVAIMPRTAVTARKAGCLATF